MKRKLLLTAGVALLCAAFFNWGQSTAMKRAFDEREKLAWPAIAPYVQGFEAFTRAQRWKNEQLDAAKYVKLAEVVEVRISKTTDSGETVISLIDVDGRRSSIWTTGESSATCVNVICLPVRSISPY